MGTIINTLHTLQAHHQTEQLRIEQLQKEQHEKLASIRKSRAEALAKVEEADRILADANEKLQAISKRAITELGQYAQPPAKIKLCLMATCDLLGFGTNLEYDKLKKLLVTNNFPRMMGRFDPTTITPLELNRLDVLYLSKPEFTVEQMKRASEVCGVLTNWLLSLRMVCKFCQDVGVVQLRTELAALETVCNGGGGLEDGVDLGPESLMMNAAARVSSSDFILTRIGDCFGDVIAEYCLMQILNYNRRTHDMKSWQNDKKWVGQASLVKYKTMKDHVVGIMGGSGNIGLAIANLLQSVGCTVHGLTNNNRKTQTTDVHKGGNVTWFAAKSGELLPFLQSGLTVLINCLPSTPDTTGLLSRDLLDQAYGSQSHHIPPLFVNVGRGDVLSSCDLIAVLQQGLFSGAALDVFEDEPLPADNPVWACQVGKAKETSSSSSCNEEGVNVNENKNSVIITPHVAGTSASVIPEIVALCRKNFLAFTNKQPLSFVVDVERGY